MKWTAFFVLAGLLHASAHTYSQGTITMSVKNEPLEKVFRMVEKQSGYRIWIDQALLQRQSPVSLQLHDASLEATMEALTLPRHLSWKKVSQMLVITTATTPLPNLPGPDPGIPIRGRVTGPHGEALAGATIGVKGEKASVAADSSGNFMIEVHSTLATLVVSSVGYETKLVAASAAQFMLVQLTVSVSKLDEVEIIGYGTTTKRLATGSVSLISKEVIQQQPVTNVLSALSGRAPGVFVQTNNGLPGGGITVQIRGTGSIAAGNQPLYIVDGVPFSGSIISSNSAIAADNTSGAVNPLNSLNPNDIESISILKDADATSIYGSRGANGVILIVTKKGRTGKTQVDFNLKGGFQQLFNFPKLMDIHEYLAIRREAFSNDGAVPSADPSAADYAPDLTVWDTTQVTDWSKYMLGETGHSLDAQVSVQGGNEHTSFLLSGTYRSEETPLPGNNRYQRGSLLMQVHHTSTNNRFGVDFSNAFVLDDYQTVNPNISIGTNVLLPPHYPIYNPNGSFNWYIDNPAARLLSTAYTKTFNLVSNVNLRYTILPGLTVKTSIGYNKISINQTLIFPKASQYPGSANFSEFGDNQREGWIVEPQLDYVHHFSNSTLNVLVGSTYQNTSGKSSFINARNFSSEDLMQSMSAAASLSASNNKSTYKYVSLFGRVNWTLDQRYLISGSVRRDGSSRFGPGKQFGNFGSAGLGWIFSQTTFVKRNFPVLSFGKLRASYGTVGNDQISDYEYLPAYSSGPGYVYQDTAGLQPLRIANDDYRWEATRKLDVAIELGLAKDRLLLTVNYYQNRSTNQLVRYAIPSITGFTSYQANLPATVENSGWEFEVSTKNIQQHDFKWQSSFNITIPKNRLLAFSNFSSSSYSQTLVLGEDITRLYAYRFAGINPGSGNAEYLTSTGVITVNPGSKDRFQTVGKGYATLYGGLGNTLVYKRWQLDIFCQFAQQYLPGGFVYTPGARAVNNYTAVLDRWQKPGDNTTIPKATRNLDFNYAGSSANYLDVAYFRLKNISLVYAIPERFLQQKKITKINLYAQAQNIWTWSTQSNTLTDPESGAISSSTVKIPPMTAVVFGIQITL